MEQRFQILNSKLLPPHFGDTIKRERLYPLLDEIPKKKLTTVIAGAGYGKTTLVAQVSKLSGLDTVWYRLDKYDRDFVTFLSYLIAGIKRLLPEFGQDTLRRIEVAQDLSQEREAILTVFLRELEHLAQKDLLIVLDDYHIIQDSQEINDSLRFTLDHLSPLVHLIIISRTEPALSLSRLRAIRQILDIREEELAFSLPEIEQLFLQLFNISLPEESLKNIRKKTDGWVSGLILFYHSLRGKNPREVNELLLKLKGSHRFISNYLEENVYTLLRDDFKNFLLGTSILSRLNAEFCNQYLKIDNSREILMALEENHLFTFSFDEEGQWYYYHHLFQDFLQTKLHHERDQQTILNFHKEAALLWSKNGEEDEALRHYLISGQHEEACKLLNEMGRRLLKEGRLQLFLSYLKKIPETYLDEEPLIQYTRARALQLSGNPDEAILSYKKAYKIFRKHESAKWASQCLTALSHMYFLVGDFVKAERKFKDLLKQAKGNSRLCINILANLIFISSHLLKMSAADKYFKEALSLLHGSKNKELLAWIYWNQGFRYWRAGDILKAMKMGKKVLEFCKDQESYHLVVLGYFLTSWPCYYLGLFEEGLKDAKKGLYLAKEKGFRTTYTWILISATMNATALGKIEEAINTGLEGLKISQDFKYRFCQAFAYHALYGAYAKSGNLSAAEEHARSGIEVIQDLILPLEEGLLKGDLAEVLLEKGRLEDVRPLLEDAERLLKKSKLNVSRVYLWYARFHWKQKQKKAALSKLLLGLKLCEAHQYDIWVIAEKRWIIPLLIEIFSQGKMQGYVMKIFKEFGLDAQEELIQLQKCSDPKVRDSSSAVIEMIQKGPPPGLQVHCLGRFRVFRGQEEIPAAKWKSKKAKLLFKYLVYIRSGGYIAKDILMELLWPDEEPKRIAHRLQVALSSLRKILEPKMTQGNASSYLLRDGDSYKLCLGEGGFVDIDAFKDKLKLAKEEANPEKGVSYLLSAEEAYLGDFLEEDLYVGWCTEERERLKTEYLDILVRIIEHFEKIHDYTNSIKYANKYIYKDGLDENIYQKLMKYYSWTGNNTMFIKTFEKCKKNMKEGLDSPISKDTEALYKRLTLI